MPSCKAFCRKAPSLRLVSLEISTTGVLARECRFSSRTLSLVHSRRLAGLTLLAMMILQLGLRRINISIAQPHMEAQGVQIFLSPSLSRAAPISERSPLGNNLVFCKCFASCLCLDGRRFLEPH